MRRSIRKALASPALDFITSLYRGCVTCLTYHRVSELGPFPPDHRVTRFDPNREMTMSLSRFEQQMALVREHYHPISADEAISGLRTGLLPEKSVLITFDDGYRDNLELALPVLEKYEIPALIFVTTSFIDRARDLWWFELEEMVRRLDALQFEWRGRRFDFALNTEEQKIAAYNELTTLCKRIDQTALADLMSQIKARYGASFQENPEMLTWDEVIELDRHPLITIGAHTVTHPALAQLTDHDLDFELGESKRILEERLGHPVEYVSYPYGHPEHAGPREFSAAEQAGYTAAFTSRFAHIQRQHGKHLHALPRVDASHYDTVEQRFADKLKGVESMISQRGRRFVTN